MTPNANPGPGGAHWLRSRAFFPNALLLSSVLACAAPSESARQPADTTTATAAAGSGPEPAETTRQLPRGGAGVPLADMLSPYPEAAWRLLPIERLGSVRIWASHLLIRHREASRSGVAFGPPEATLVPPVERSRADARELALALAREARAAPERFAELSARYSDDEMTRFHSGSLGALHGYSPVAHPQVLDAFSALRPGEVSEAVETDHGFHLFRLREPPPPREVQAAHVVIAYDGATWLKKHLARGPVGARTRARALELATTVYEQARAAPHEFARLVAEYSDHFDARRGGDFGAWSSEQPGAYGREIELLLELPVYGVAPPIDSLYGFEVLQRTPDRPRPSFALQAIRLPFDPDAPPGAPESRANALGLATSLLGRLATDPGVFPELQRAHCCAGRTQTWSESQQPTELAYLAEGLDIGEITSVPVQFSSSYVIARRVDPSKVPAPSALAFRMPTSGP